MAGEFLLPPLREDLSLNQGRNDLFGRPTWTIFDPIKHRYFQIDRQAVDFLANWSIGRSNALLDIIEQQRGYRPSHEELTKLSEFLTSQGLTCEQPTETWRTLYERNKRAKGSMGQWLTHKYLFFRVPLFRPQRILNATAWLIEPFFSKLFWLVIAALALINIYFINRLWDDFESTFFHFLTFEGMFYYAIIIVFVKVFHELGHALTAVRYHCRVPTIGIAFLVFYPVLYTDVTDAWKITDKSAALKLWVLDWQRS